MGKRPLMLSAALVALCLVLLGWRFQSSGPPVAAALAPSATLTDAPSGATKSAAPTTKDSVEVCGRGTMSANDAAALLYSLLPVADRFDADLLDRLTQSPDPAARALGLSWRIHRIKDAKEQAESAPGICSSQDCQALAARVQSDWQQLRGLAATSTDPYVYSLGRKTCAWTPNANCSAFSALRLSQLDPSNAWTWLEVLHEARQNKQVTQVRDALEKFSQTRRFESGEARSLSLMLDHAPSMDDRSHAAIADLAILGRMAAIATPSLQSLVPVCKTGTNIDPHVSSLCLTAARNLTYQSDTISGSLSGAQLMQHLGISGDELQAARDHAQAAMFLDSDGVDSNAGAGFSCSEVQRLHQQLLDRAKYGEMAAIALTMQREGLSDAQVVQRYQNKVGQARSLAEEQSRSASRLPF
jgi:hypothetical protein